MNIYKLISIFGTAILRNLALIFKNIFKNMNSFSIGHANYQNIKNIIFDLGGIIVEIDYQITIGMFKKLGISDFDSLYGQYKQSNLFDGFDKGHVSPGKFREGLSQFLHKSIDKSDFDAAWNSMIKELPAQKHCSA